MHNFKELAIWKDAMKMAKAVYVLSSDFPDGERYGLTSQIRRCAISVPSNIAEGAGRNTDKEFLRFLAISSGSSFELETQLLLSVDLDFVKKDHVDGLLNKLATLQKMIYRFQEQLKIKVDKSFKGLDT